MIFSDSLANEKVCYDSIKSECNENGCPFKHLEEQELLEEIKNYTNIIEEKCFTKKNSSDIMVSLLPIFEENLKDSNLCLLCLIKELLNIPDDINNLAIEFFHFFKSNDRICSKFFKKLAHFSKLETLRLQFIGDGNLDNKDDDRLKAMTNFAEQLKRLNNWTLYFGNWLFKSDYFQPLFHDFNTSFSKLKHFNLIIEDFSMQHLFFFKPLFDSNISHFSIRLARFSFVNFEKENANFFVDLFGVISEIDVQKISIKQKFSISNELKIALFKNTLEIEFCGQELENIFNTSFDQMFHMLRKLKLLKDLSLETKFNAFEKYHRKLH